MRTLLLIGKNGQVGHALQGTLAALGRVVAVGRDRIDLLLPETIRATVRSVEPDVIVNAAAYTDVDQAETERDRAKMINGTAPGILAEEAKRLGALFVHYSTDYVFDGTKTAPYVEIDAPNPMSAYGHTKLDGEQVIRRVGGPHLILRTSWVYSRRRTNFLQSMLRLGRERDRLQVVDDQTGSPTWAPWIAGATTRILEQILERNRQGPSEGLYHLSSQGAATWLEFAQAIFEIFGVDTVTVEPIPSSAYPTEASRPAYSVLSNQKVKTDFSLEVPTWEEQLRMARQSGAPSEDGIGRQH
jgi:dTDP-4-dehydrorhamnose reductase